MTGHQDANKTSHPLLNIRTADSRERHLPLCQISGDGRPQVIVLRPKRS